MNQPGLRLEALHEEKMLSIDAGCGQRGSGFRSLQREEYPVERLHLAIQAVGEGLQPRRVGIGVTGIGDDHEALVAQPGDDQIVQDSGTLVEQERVFRLVFCQRCRVERAGARQQRIGLSAGHQNELHMRDVEEARMLARVQVLLHHAGRIGQRHGPAGEGPETGSGGFMQILKGEFSR